MQNSLNFQNIFSEGRNFNVDFENFIHYLDFLKFSSSTIKRYKTHLLRFKSFCIQNNILNFLATSTISDYLASLTSSHNYTIQFSRKVLGRFKDYLLTGSFRTRYLGEVSMPTSSELINTLIDFEKYLDNSEIKNSTKQIQFDIIKNFLISLEKNDNISFFHSLSSQNIIDFLNNSNLANSSKALSSRILKKFLNFTYSKKLTSFSGNQLFPKIKYNTNERIPSFYSSEEIFKLISVIDTSFPTGKRNYAIILLASVLGLRASDIVSLKFENIDWDNKIIRIIQQKTQKELIQPFTDEIFFALLDYIKNGRPCTHCENIFVSFTTPHLQLKTKALSAMVTRYFSLTDIDISSRKHGIHSLRHSFANNMLHNNISLQNVSAPLGHSYIQTTTLYTNIDFNTLRLLCLEVN